MDAPMYAKKDCYKEKARGTGSLWLEGVVQFAINALVPSTFRNTLLSQPVFPEGPIVGCN
jgi:hypothetical protein